MLTNMRSLHFIVAALLWQSSSALEGLVDARRNVDRASSIRNITCSHVNLPVEDLKSA